MDKSDMAFIFNAFIKCHYLSSGRIIVKYLFMKMTKNAFEHQEKNQTQKDFYYITLD